MEIKYQLIDPTGNITALVKTKVPVSEQPFVANKICEQEPTCEQVGFISINAKEKDYDIELRMAGGEFCGNATMSTAAFYAKENAIKAGNVSLVHVKASGAEEVVPVEIVCEDKNTYRGTVKMPVPKGIISKTFYYKDKEYTLPVVMFKGMYHAVVEGDLSKKLAEEVIKSWCKEQNIEAFGLMLLNEKERRIDPLVYVDAVESLFWENSCASGTTAVGYYLYNKYEKPIDISFSEPGGKLAVKVDDNNNLKLSGKVQFTEKAKSIDLDI